MTLFHLGLFQHYAKLCRLPPRQCRGGAGGGAAISGPISEIRLGIKSQTELSKHLFETNKGCPRHPSSLIHLPPPPSTSSLPSTYNIINSSSRPSLGGLEEATPSTTMERVVLSGIRRSSPTSEETHNSVTGVCRVGACGRYTGRDA